MAQTSSRQTARRGWVFPERRLLLEEIKRLEALDEVAGLQLEDTLLGVKWLQTKRLVGDSPAGVLTLD
ncbi:hypothetical protein NIES4071_41070 [Calothrix sp. NIES-4071]|nr:hypothetical protein NIES4071_41070 [Calothrix sp. NIES-4071]BAZ58423.1 hypothetical protein NIES4105_41010 [Calothrix sp. NIES-4105]